MVKRPPLAGRLESDVRALAEGIGERNMYRDGSLDEAAAWIEARMAQAGYRPLRQSYELSGIAMSRYAGQRAENLIAKLPGMKRTGEIVVIGAHYDTVLGSPGANDNASAIAVLLALAERFADQPQRRAVRFVAFVNEEPPFFLSRDMGSYAFASHSRALREQITAMIAMDGLGYYSTEPGSQHYPAPGLRWRYPDTASFISFVTRVRDRRLLRQALSAFRKHATVPSEGAILPRFVPGVSWSDHWSFWQHAYPALLVTDTLPFRDPCYHTPLDTPDRLDFGRMAGVAEGLADVVARLADM